jgi:hypothetical protein
MTLYFLDLFSGSGAASRAAAVRGWRVFRIDIAPDSAADLRTDLRYWNPDPADKWDLVWASPPCAALSTANNRTRDLSLGLELVKTALRIIDQTKPRWWVLENVHGATRAIASLIGPPVATYGSFYLWGVFPPFDAKVPRNKTKMTGRRRAENRARIPWEISEGLVKACERLALELPPALEFAPDLFHSSPDQAPAGSRAASSPASAGSRVASSPAPAGAPLDPGILSELESLKVFR